MFRSLYIWPERPLLSLLASVGVSDAIPAPRPRAHAHVAPAHEWALVRPLRLGARWLGDAAARLRVRNREVLLAHGCARSAFPSSASWSV
jgi:hypothetical protein